VVEEVRKYSNLHNRCAMSVKNNHRIIRHPNTVENAQCCQNI